MTTFKKIYCLKKCNVRFKNENNYHLISAISRGTPHFCNLPYSCTYLVKQYTKATRLSPHLVTFNMILISFCLVTDLINQNFMQTHHFRLKFYGANIIFTCI